jgi:hypothetical protein
MVQELNYRINYFTNTIFKNIDDDKLGRDKLKK